MSSFSHRRISPIRSNQLCLFFISVFISAVAPFRYSRLLIGIGLGVFWFGEALTPRMLIGSAIIILAGLFLLWRGKAR